MNWCGLIGKATSAEHRNVCSSLFQASKHIYFFINFLLLLLSTLEILNIYEVTFFASVWLHDNFNFIFHIMTQKHGLDWTLHLLCCIIHPLTIFGWGGSSSNSINMTGPMALNARKSTTSSSSSSSSSSPLASKPVALSSPTWSAEPGFSSSPTVKTQSTGQELQDCHNFIKWNTGKAVLSENQGLNQKQDRLLKVAISLRCFAGVPSLGKGL